LPGAAIATGIGIVLGVAYLLRALQQGFFDEPEPPAAGSGEEDRAPLEPITLPEKAGALLLLAATLLVGLFPRLLLDYILPSVRPLVGGFAARGGS
jgi:NADH-quinone oxidoreductase subunit M